MVKVSELTTVRIGDSIITTAISARNLGVWLDSTMSFNVQVATVCRSCYGRNKRLARIRCYLTVQPASLLDAAIVASKLDYGISLQGGITVSL